LAAIQLLEGIGAIKSCAGRRGAYQESVTAPVDRGHDDNAALINDTDDDDGNAFRESEDHFETLWEVLSAIDKVCHASHKRISPIGDLTAS